jgi:hypothetical protein
MVTRSLCLLVLLALSASAQTPRIPPPESVNRNGLVGRWLVPGFLGAAGLQPAGLLDASGNGRTATTTGGPAVQTAQRVALRVDSDSKYATIADFADATSPGGLTLVAWINTADTGYQYLVTKWQSGTSGQSYQLRLEPSGVVHFVTAETNGQYSSSREINGTIAVNNGKWRLVVATYDGVTQKIFVDGGLNASKGTGGSLFDNVTPLNLGNISGNTFNGNNLVGGLGECRIYKRALTADEIKRIYRGLE